MRSSRLPRSRVLAWSVFFAALVAASSHRALAATPSFFNSVETVSKNLRPFTKWNGRSPVTQKRKRCVKKAIVPFPP